MKLIFWQHTLLTAGKRFAPYWCSWVNIISVEKATNTHVLQLIKGGERRLGECRPWAAAGDEDNSFTLQLLISYI